MSWSLSIRPRQDRDELKSAIEHAEPEHEVTEEAEQQLAAAKEAAAAIIDSGAVGRGDDHLAVNLAGHSNRDHSPTEGFANESVTVTVSQYQPPHAEPPE